VKRQSTKFVIAIVVVHLILNIVHGLAHRELHIDISSSSSIFVIVVVLLLPLVAMALVCTAQRQLGLFLLSGSMFGSLLFGLYHHFVIESIDRVHLPPRSLWEATFALTAYGLVVLEAIGTYIGIRFLDYQRC